MPATKKNVLSACFIVPSSPNLVLSFHRILSQGNSIYFSVDDLIIRWYTVSVVIKDKSKVGGTEDTMAFEFKLSTDEIREKMFDFLKPVSIDIDTWDFELRHINWIYGVYDSESNYFITYVNSGNDNSRYILITENGGIFYVIINHYTHTFSEIPKELMPYKSMIYDGIRLYNNEIAKKLFERRLSAEQKKNLDEIIENIKDRCRPESAIRSCEDAERLFEQEHYNYYRINRYNKSTVENFNTYMSDEKMCTIRGKKYRSFARCLI